MHEGFGLLMAAIGEVELKQAADPIGILGIGRHRLHERHLGAQGITGLAHTEGEQAKGLSIAVTEIDGLGKGGGGLAPLFPLVVDHANIVPAAKELWIFLHRAEVAGERFVDALFGEVEVAER